MTETRWKVEILSTSGNERLLRDVLAAFSIEVTGPDRPLFLVSTTFETCKAASDVYVIASRAEASINSARKYDDELAGELRLEIGSVLEQRPDHTWAAHHFLSAALTGVSAVGIAGTLTDSQSPPLSEDDRLRLEARRHEERYQQLCRKAVSRVISASRDERALRVQRLLAGDLTPSRWDTSLT